MCRVGREGHQVVAHRTGQLCPAQHSSHVITEQARRVQGEMCYKRKSRANVKDLVWNKNIKPLSFYIDYMLK